MTFFEAVSWIVVSCVGETQVSLARILQLTQPGLITVAWFYARKDLPAPFRAPIGRSELLFAPWHVDSIPLDSIEGKASVVMIVSEQSAHDCNFGSFASYQSCRVICQALASCCPIHVRVVNLANCCCSHHRHIRCPLSRSEPRAPSLSRDSNWRRRTLRPITLDSRLSGHLLGASSHDGRPILVHLPSLPQRSTILHPLPHNRVLRRRLFHPLCWLTLCSSRLRVGAGAESATASSRFLWACATCAVPFAWRGRVQCYCIPIASGARRVAVSMPAAGNGSTNWKTAPSTSNRRLTKSTRSAHLLFYRNRTLSLLPLFLTASVPCARPAWPLWAANNPAAVKWELQAPSREP